MEETNKQLRELMLVVKELKEENVSLKNTIAEGNSSLKEEIRALKSEMLLMSQNNQQQQQQKERHLVTFTPSMPTKYNSKHFVTSDEKKEIQFEVGMGSLTHSDYDDLAPGRFRSFKMTDADCNVKYPRIANYVELDKFKTPVAGRYRFDIFGKVMVKDEHDTADKADWYICSIPLEHDIYDEEQYRRECHASDDDEDEQNDDGDDNGDARRKKKEEMRERKRIFDEKKRRQFLFSSVCDFEENECSVGVECEDGILFWVEVCGKFSSRYESCFFGGQLMC